MTTQARSAIDLVVKTLAKFDPAIIDSPGMDYGLSLKEREDLLRLAFIGLHVPPETAGRVARWLEHYTRQPDHQSTPPAHIVGRVFEDNHNEMVIVKDLQFTALCEHHLLPFHGSAAIGYIPNGRIVGLSKTSRLLNYYCQWPTLQEHITSHVADAMVEALAPKGVMVVLYDVVHSCMSFRGVEDPEANTTTSAIRGVFREGVEAVPARNEFLMLMKG